MRRWLLKKDDAVDEPDFPIATDAELQCTQTGQVLTDFKDVSVFDLNRRREQELDQRREAASEQSSKEAFRTEVKNTTRSGRLERQAGAAPRSHSRAPNDRSNLSSTRALHSRDRAAAAATGPIAARRS